MSKVGNPENIGQLFKPIITNAPYTELMKIKNDNISIGIYNGFIVSVPQNNGEDIQGAGSIWMTDSEGKLYQLTEPMIKQMV